MGTPSVEKAGDEINNRPDDSYLAVFLPLKLGEFLVCQGNRIILFRFFSLIFHYAALLVLDFLPDQDPVFRRQIHRRAFRDRRIGLFLLKSQISGALEGQHALVALGEHAVYGVLYAQLYPIAFFQFECDKVAGVSR